MFAYCNNNPVAFSDPTGHSIVLTCIIVGAIIGAVAGGCAGAYISKKQTGKVNAWAVVGGAVGGAVIGGLVGWGVGVAITTVGATATGTAIASSTPAIQQTYEKISTSGTTFMQYVAEKGRAGEVAANIVKNYSHIDSLTGTASYRIPDGLDKGLKILSEVKNYSGTLSYTNQLRDFVMWSQEHGYQMHLYTNAQLTGPLQQLVDSGVIKIFPLG